MPITLPRHPSAPHSLGHGPLASLLASAVVVLLAPAPGSAEPLYTLKTTCALNGAAAVPCTVEAIDKGAVTAYRHIIGGSTETVSISDAPVRMNIWRPETKVWQPIRSATARFSTNTICFNGKELCVVNPNYLNSVRQSRSDTNLVGRDLVMLHFGQDGRVDATCYDDACSLIQK